MLSDKKSISALQVQRMMNLGSYKTAHYMGHSIRAGRMDESFTHLISIIEVYGTFVGGRP